MKEINELYDKFCIDFNQNFFTFTKEELDNFKNILTKEDLKEMEDSLSEIFTYPIQSVTYDRPSIVDDLDKRQYFSVAMYFWPNPDTKDTLPYIRKDGHVNPDAIKWAKGGLRKTGLISYYAGLMYYFTKEAKYYDLLKKQLVNFFINDETKMLPNLLYAQLIMGDAKHGKGRGTGIIDFAGHYGYAFVILKHLYDANLLEEELYQSLKSWVSELLVWLNTSDFGLDEKKAHNNHGTMFTLLIAHLNFFIGKLDNCKEELTNEINQRLTSQTNSDGVMPDELGRTRALSYTMMNIKAFVDTYKLLGVDYTKVELLNKAFKFISPVLNNEIKLEDISVVDEKTGKTLVCSQLEGTYPDNFKYYLVYLGKKFGVKIICDENINVPYKYYLLK